MQMSIFRVVLLQSTRSIPSLANEAREMIDFQMSVQLILIEIVSIAEVASWVTFMRFIVEVSLSQVSGTEKVQFRNPDRLLSASRSMNHRAELKGCEFA